MDILRSIMEPSSNGVCRFVQLKQKASSHTDAAGSSLLSTACGSSGSSSGKQLVILQERLTHQKQRLDILNAR